MRSLTDRYWNIPSEEMFSDTAVQLSKKLKLTPEITQILVARGFKGVEEVEKFLYPKLKDLPSPFILKDIEKACSIIYNHIKRDGKIYIWGDYDVDGVTATSLLVRFFRTIGCDVKFHIPDRFAEGYGLNISKLHELYRPFAEDHILITVDCGITSHEKHCIYKKKWRNCDCNGSSRATRFSSLR